MKLNPIGPRRRNREGGFTLVELTAVIAVVGVVSAAALPRLTAMTGEARRASLNTAAAALSTVATLSHAGFLVNRKTTQSFQDGTVALVHGYPAANPATAEAAGLGAAYVILPRPGEGAMTLVPRDIAGTPNAADCFLVYEQASPANPLPKIRIGDNATARTCS